MAGHDISQESEIIRQAFLEYSRYLVAIAYLAQPLKNGKEHGDAQTFWMSGFIIEIGKRWYWVTAGHCLEDLRSATEAGLYSVREFKIADCFGLGAIDRSAIPFNSNHEQRVCRCL